MSRAVTITLIGALAMSAPCAGRAQQPAKPNAATPSSANAIDAATRTEILAARDAIWRAWFANDTAALGRLLPRSTTAGEGGGWQTRDEIVGGAARSAASGRHLISLNFDDTRIHTNGNVAVVFSNYSLVLEGNGQRSTVTGNASEVFVRADGIWRNPFWYLGPPALPAR